MSWKSVGGINYSSNNRYIRAGNFSADTIVANDSLGKKDTTTYVEGDLFFQDGCKLYSTENEIDKNGLYAHFPFNKINSSNNPRFINESKNENIDPTKSDLYENFTISAGGISTTIASNPAKLFFDASYGSTLYLEPNSAMLVSDASFNPSSQITNNVLNNEYNAVTINCWQKIKKPTSETPDTGFLLFGIDTKNMINTFTEAVGRSRIDGQIDHLEPSFYFFCPGYGHNDPQIYWTEDVSSAYIRGETRASAKSNTPLVYDSWNMITLIVRAREVEIYRNGELTDVFNVSGRMPNNKFNFIINGSRFYDILNGTWVSTGKTSEHDVKIIDYKIFNYACHPEYIKILYKHYSELTNLRTENFSQIHTNTSYNYLIDSSFSLFSSTMFVQGDMLSIGKHEVFNKQTVYGPSEIFNDSHISGSLGIGIIDTDEKLHVRGNIKSSGNLYLGFEDISVNGIYFKGYGPVNNTNIDNSGDLIPFYKHSTLEERFYVDPSSGDVNFPYQDQPFNTELLLFKGNDADINKQHPRSISEIDSITDASWNNTQGDRIRIKAPNILFDTYDSSINDIGDQFKRFEENHRMIFDQSGNLGINTIYAKQRLDVRGKINLQTDHRYDISSNIYISNTKNPDPADKGIYNTGVGGNIFISENFDSSANVAIGYASQKELTTGIENSSLGYNSLKHNQTGNYNTSIGTFSAENVLTNYNTSMGYESLNKNYIGESNTSIGFKSMRNDASGNENTSIGYLSMMDTSGNFNTSLGAHSLKYTKTDDNTSIGHESQHLLQNGTYNTTLGSKSLKTNVDGSNNVAIGFSSMENKKGSNNVSVGALSLHEKNLGEDNVSIGYQSMHNTSGNNNVSIGTYSLQETKTHDNISIGHQSQKISTNATENLSIGSNTLLKNVIGSENIAIGMESQMEFEGESNSHNTTVGHKTLHQNKAGKFNTSLGHQTLHKLVSGDENTAVGHDSLHNNLSSDNNAFGSKSLYTNSSGTNNAAFGNYSLYYNISGNNNIGVGNESLYTSTSNNNLALGYKSQRENISGHDNISLGVESLINEKGSYNIAMGTESLKSATDGSNNNSISIGYRSQADVTDNSNNISIGNYALRVSQKKEHDNIAIGFESMSEKKYGSKNIAMGSYAYKGVNNPTKWYGESNLSIGFESMFDTSANFTIGIGEKALRKTLTDGSVAIGYESQILSQDASNNVSLGYKTLHSNVSGHENVAIGHESQINTTSNYNTSLGYNTLYSNISGPDNVAIGNKSQFSGLTGISNISLGNSTLYSTSDGSHNVAIGHFSQNKNQSGYDNVSVGYKSQFDSHGNHNISMGEDSLYFEKGSNNIGIGSYSLQSLTDGSNNNSIALGFKSQSEVTDGSNNISMGNYSLQKSSRNQHDNIAIGHESMQEKRFGNRNIALGSSAYKGSNHVNRLYGEGNISVGHESMLDTSCNLNIAIGERTMKQIVTDRNIAIGYESQTSSVDASNNVSMGYKTLHQNISGHQNVAIGYESQINNKNDSNTSVGFKTLHSNVDGSNNIAVGHNTLYSNTSGYNLVGLGNNSLYSNKDGDRNMGLGNHSLHDVESGNDNISLGYYSQYKTKAEKNISLGNYSLVNNTQGNNNTAIGYYSMNDNISGNTNISVGHYSMATSTIGDHNIAIGTNSLETNILTTNAGNKNISIGFENSKQSHVGNNLISIGAKAMYDNSGGLNNLAIGEKSMHNNISGESNIAIGENSGFENIDGYHNIALGFDSMYSNERGTSNIAIGQSSARDNADGSFNIGIGLQSMLSNLRGISNVFVGEKSGYNNTDGSYNFGIGYRSMFNNQLGHGNYSIGNNSMYNNESGISNLSIGNSSMYENKRGISNIAIGEYSSYSNLDGSYNLAIGFKSMYNNTDGSSNIAIGNESMYQNTDGSNNVAMGYRAMYNNTRAYSMLSLGQESAYFNTDGSYNVSIGYQSMYSNTDGSSNVSIGTRSMFDNTAGTHNISIGYESMYKNQSGISNISMGDKSLYNNNEGNYNVSVGFESLNANTSGTENISIGKFSMQDNIVGNKNISLGLDSLRNAENADNNISIGEKALYNNDTSMNIAIGYKSQYTSIDGSANLSIGNYSLEMNNKGDYNTAVGWKSQQKTNSVNEGTEAASHNSSFGFHSMKENNTGEKNVAVGSFSLENNKDNDYNTAVGYKSLNSNNGNNASGNTAIGFQSMMDHVDNNNQTADQGNTALGYQSLMTCVNGRSNVAVGSRAMYDASENSFYNVAMGNEAMEHGAHLRDIAIGYQSNESNINGKTEDNISIGYRSLSTNHDGDNNISVGNYAMENIHVGDRNNVFGHAALQDVSGASDNIAIGYKSLNANKNQSYNISIGNQSQELSGKKINGFEPNTDKNISIGHQSLHEHLEGSENIFIGYRSGFLDVSGNQNVAIGTQSLAENIDGSGNTAVGYQSGLNCKGEHNVMLGYEASAVGSARSTEDDDNGFGDFVNKSIAIGYKPKVYSTENIAIGSESNVNFASIGNDDISGSIAFGNYSTVTKTRSMAIGVDSSANIHHNTIVIGETIPFKFLKPDHATNPSYTTEESKYNNFTSTRKFDETVKVCIGTQSYIGEDTKEYKFRVDGSANITGDLKVDGNVIFTGDTIETVDHQIIRMSEQLDISNTGIAPALKIRQYGKDTAAANNYNYNEGSIIEVYDGDVELTDVSDVRVFHIKNGGNTFFRNNVDISRNVIIYNHEVSKNRDPNEIDPSFNHLTVGAYPGYSPYHNSTMRNKGVVDETVNGIIRDTYPDRPTKYLPAVYSETVDGKDYRKYDFAGGRDGKGQYAMEISGNVFIHNYMKIETNRPFENSFEVHTTDGIQLPSGTTSERPGNYYYHANNPDPNINNSVYPLDSGTQVFQVNNFTGNSSDGSIRYNTDTSQCEIYSGGNMWTGLPGYRTEQAPYFLKYDLGQSQVTPNGTLPIRHNSTNLSVFKTGQFVDTAWRRINTIYNDAFTGLPYPLYHHTIVDISTNSGWQLYKVLNGNVTSNAVETLSDISNSFSGKLSINDFTTTKLADLPDYPDKPVFDSDEVKYISKEIGGSFEDVSLNSSGYLNLDPDLSYNVRVYALNKSKRKPNFIYLNNLFLLRVAYPGIVGFGFIDTGVTIGATTYYPFQNYLQDNVKMNLSFLRTIKDDKSNDNRMNVGQTAFHPDNISYPSIQRYNVYYYAIETKCFFDHGSLEQLNTGDSSKGFKNTSTTELNSGQQIINSYGGSSTANNLYHLIYNDDFELPQRDLSLNISLLPGTKYGFKLSAQNNRNPYFSHSDQNPSGGTGETDRGDGVMIPDNDVGSKFVPNPSVTGGEFPASFTNMPYFTNVDDFTPPSGTEDPLYIKYVNALDLSHNGTITDISNITFGGHRNVTVFDPTQTSKSRIIPYYNQFSEVYSESNPDGFPSGATGKYFDISGEENFFVNFNRQGMNCRNVNEISRFRVGLKKNNVLKPYYSITFKNTDTNNFIVSTGDGSQEDGVFSLDKILSEAASEDKNKGFVKSANVKIVPSSSRVNGIQNDSGELKPSREEYKLNYEIDSPVTIDINDTVGGYLDGVSIQNITGTDYPFYIDNFNDSNISYSKNSASITVQTANIKYLFGIPSAVTVTLAVDYQLNNYANQFLPAIEVDTNNKTMISKIVINPLIVSVNGPLFGGQNVYDVNDRKKYIGIDENYVDNTGYSNLSSIQDSWPNIYLKQSYVPTTSEDLKYHVVGFHINNTINSQYNNVGLLSNHETTLSSSEFFTPSYNIWTDRNSYLKDANGLINNPNLEGENFYRSVNGYTDDGTADFINSSTPTPLNVTANDFVPHDNELIYIDGKFIGPGYVSTLNSVNPFISNTTNAVNGTSNHGSSTWDTSTTGLSLLTKTMKFLILKIPTNQVLAETGYVDISNLQINGNNLNHHIGSDGEWPASFDDLFVWVSQMNASTRLYGSVNKLFNPTESNWFLNNSSNNKLENSYSVTESFARSIDNPSHIRINLEKTNQMYLVIGLDNTSTKYINFNI